MNERDKREKRTRLGVVVLSVALFVISLSQDAFVFDDFDGQKVLSSLDVLLTGAFAFLGGGLLEQLIWDANVLFVIGLFTFYRGKSHLLGNGVWRQRSYRLLFWVGMKFLLRRMAGLGRLPP